MLRNKEPKGVINLEDQRWYHLNSKTARKESVLTYFAILHSTICGNLPLRGVQLQIETMLIITIWNVLNLIITETF